MAQDTLTSDHKPCVVEDSWPSQLGVVCHCSGVGDKLDGHVDNCRLTVTSVIVQTLHALLLTP
jgi:hypothetical protein